MYNRILITGSRDFDDYDLMTKVLTHAKSRSAPNAVLIHGAARGADLIAAVVWARLGMNPEPHPAKWKQFGKAAGHIRNQEMVDTGADICLAFPVGDSTGTRDCMKRASEAGIRVINLTEENASVQEVPSNGGD